MRSILKHLLKNRIVILSVFDIAIIFWIAWYESRIEYERLLENEYNILSEMGLPTIPLCEVIYNTIIVAIVVNMIVSVLELRRIRKKKLVKHDLMIAFTYFSLIVFCMLWGSFYLSSRICSGIINESNTLFRLPIWLFGEESFTNVVTVQKLYMLLCIIHLSICFYYMFLCFHKINVIDGEPNNQTSGDSKTGGDSK